VPCHFASWSTTCFGWIDRECSTVSSFPSNPGSSPYQDRISPRHALSSRNLANARYVLNLIGCRRLLASQGSRRIAEFQITAIYSKGPPILDFYSAGRPVVLRTLGIRRHVWSHAWPSSSLFFPMALSVFLPGSSKCFSYHIPYLMGGNWISLLGMPRPVHQLHYLHRRMVLVLPCRPYLKRDVHTSERVLNSMSVDEIASHANMRPLALR